VIELAEDKRWHRLMQPPVRLLLGIAGALEQQGDARRALEYYDTAIQAAPTDPATLRALVKKGGLLAELGDNSAARAAFTSALAHPACDDIWRTTAERALSKVAS
jgi:tetratricopeptide (TPR) repeat protein